MPCDAIVVHIVQYGQTLFLGLVDVVFGVIGLWALLVTGLRPGVVSPSLWNAVGGLDLLASCGPEPTVNVLGLQIGTVLAASEIANATSGPDVGHIVLLDDTEDQVVLLLGLQCDQIHAVFAAQITAVQPVDLPVGQSGHVGA